MYVGPRRTIVVEQHSAQRLATCCFDTRAHGACAASLRRETCNVGLTLKTQSERRSCSTAFALTVLRKCEILPCTQTYNVMSTVKKKKRARLIMSKRTRIIGIIGYAWKITYYDTHS